MKKLPITLFIILFAIVCNAQSIKTYSGKYNNGTAKYEYYENNDYERIYNGYFSYESPLSTGLRDINSGKTMLTRKTISGRFKNNKKDGLWECKEMRAMGEDPSESKAVLFRITKGNFENGKRVGIWSYIEKGIKNGKEVLISNCTYTFRNNVLVGKISCYGVEGVIDDDGNFTGEWSLKGQRELIANFEKNIFTKLILREVSTGEIIKKYSTDNAKYFINDSITSINGVRFGLVNCTDNTYDEDMKLKTGYTVYGNEYFKSFYDNFPLLVYDLFEDIPLGSESIIIKKPKVIVEMPLNNDEKLLVLKKEKWVRFVNFADSLYQIGDYEYALINYQEAETIFKDGALKTKIELSKEQFNNLKKKYSELVAEADLLVKQKMFDAALKKYQEANKLARDNQLSSKIQNLKSEKEKHFKFLEERVSKKYTQDELETKQVNDAIKQIESRLFDYLKQKPNEKLEEHGNIVIIIDTLGAIKNYIFTPFGMQQRDLTNLIDSELLKIKINPILLNNYAVSAELRFKLDIVADNGKIKYDNIGTKIIVKKGEPSRSVITYLSAKHYGQEAFENKKIKYEFYKINELVNFNELED